MAYSHQPPRALALLRPSITSLEPRASRLPPSVAHVALTDEDTRYLRSECGTGAALAMRVVSAVAASMGASRLVDIESAHVDGCLYVGSVSIDFARALVDGGARVSVPTTLNVGSIDLQHPRNPG
jgi:predicted aconitase